MKYIFLALIFPLSVFAGVWFKVDSQTIKFLGDIKDDEYERFQAVFDSHVRVLIVTSGGGSTLAALRIASAMEKQNYTIIVRTWCLSSCANYFFTAAKKKIIENGIVGFHGNINACNGEDKWPTTEEAIRNQMASNGVTSDKVDLAVKNFHENLISMRMEERAFFDRIGVSQSLFDISCTSDKGKNDGQSYSFLLPKKETFKKYKIDNITGDQDEDTINWYPGKLLVN